MRERSPDDGNALQIAGEQIGGKYPPSPSDICAGGMTSSVAACGESPAEASLRRTEELARLEAVLFAAAEPMPAARLARLADIAATERAQHLVEELNRLLDADATPFRVEELAGGYQMLTRAEFADHVRLAGAEPTEPQLSPPAAEVLAIISDRQPICRADIEAIRGVQVSEILNQLLDRGLIRIVGRDETLGRPYLYGTTKKFLESLGLRSLNELPGTARQAASHQDGATEQSPSP